MKYDVCLALTACLRSAYRFSIISGLRGPPREVFMVDLRFALGHRPAVEAALGVCLDCYDTCIQNLQMDLS